MPDEPTPDGGTSPVHPAPGAVPQGRPEEGGGGAEPHDWYGPPGQVAPYGQPDRSQWELAPPPSHGPYAPYSGHYGAPQGAYAPPWGNQPPGGYQSGPYAPPGAPYSWPYIPPPPPRPPASPEERRRRRRLRLAFAALLVLAVGAGIGIGAAIAPTNPATVAQALVNKAITAATNAGSYRYTEHSTVLGAPDDITGDAGPTGGRQVITQRCKSGTNVFDLRLVKGVVYFRGNSPAIVDQLGVASTHARSLVGRWVKVVKGETPYSSFADGITTSSNISQLRTTIVTRASKTVAGSSPQSTEIVGALSAGKGKRPIGTAALLIDASTSLPRTLRATAVTAAGRYTLTWTFKDFGEHVRVVAPANPIAYAGLHASTPSKSACV